MFHVSKLKPAFIDQEGSFPARRTHTLQPEPELVEGQEEYLVDRILAERTVRGRKQYLVRWQGYDQSEDTWEPARNLQNAMEKLREFEARN
ncbi:MAG: hypothetical protein Phog2KO_51120 [Phototrophicaceae bacterium]